MNAALQHLTENWKSTLQSILTTTFALTGTLMLSSVIKPHTAAILVAVNGVCKVLLGVFQTDGVQVPAGTTIKQTSTITTPPASYLTIGKLSIPEGISTVTANPTQLQEKTK